jgi:DegV family protein with EDD domain
MNDYIIATASTADLTPEYVSEHHIPFIPYTFTIDDVEYKDDLTPESRAELYRMMRADKQPHTSAISVYAYHEFFKKLMDTGKDVLFTDMSRAISSSIENGQMAARQIQEEYPNQRIYFLDSFCITGGLNLFVKQLVQRHEDGMSYDDVIAWGEAHKKEYIHRFMVDDLKWLRRGGRLSNASAIVGTLLSIKPLIYVANNGSLISFETVRGRKKCLKRLIDTMKDDLADYTSDEEMTIINSDCLSDAEAVRDEIRKVYPQLANANITTMTLGPVIAAHCGPDFIAIIYHGKPRVM